VDLAGIILGEEKKGDVSSFSRSKRMWARRYHTRKKGESCFLIIPPTKKKEERRDGNCRLHGRVGEKEGKVMVCSFRKCALDLRGGKKGKKGQEERGEGPILVDLHTRWRERRKGEWVTWISRLSSHWW